MTASLPRFLVFEGIDGSGTTTQIRRVSQALQARGHRVVETCEPSPGPIGTLTRELLAVDGAKTRTVNASGLALLFAADRLEHLARTIDPALEAGDIVLCDRYVVSSWVYQSLDCDPEWVRTINHRARWPDLTFVFDLEPERALARVAARRAQTGEAVERFDVPETQRRLAAGYRAVLRDPPKLGGSDLPGILAVDAAAPIEAVSASILEVLVAKGL